MTSSSDSPGSSQQQPLQCPRCESMDTKFCYYNNYSTAQPRHFCKNCKRYWTAGGSLRNVPIGGGMRKNKKAKISNKQVHELMSSPSSSSQQQQQQQKLGDGYYSPNPNSNGFLEESSSLGPAMFTASPSSSTDNRHGDEGGYVHGSDSMANYYNSSAFRYFESPAESHSYGSPFMNPANFNWRASPYGGFYGQGHGHGFQPDGYSSQQQQHHDAAAYAAFMHHQFPLKPFDHTQAQSMAQNQAQAQIQVQTQAQAQTQKAQAQAQTNSCEVSEVVSEPSQASSDALKDPHLSMHRKLSQYTMLNKHQPTTEENVIAAWQQNSQNSQSQVHDNSPSSINEVAMPVPDGHHNKDRSSTEEDEDELGNVVNVNPNDWEQVSEVLFGGTADFFSLTGF